MPLVWEMRAQLGDGQGVDFTWVHTGKDHIVRIWTHLSMVKMNLNVVNEFAGLLEIHDELVLLSGHVNCGSPMPDV